MLSVTHEAGRRAPERRNGNTSADLYCRTERPVRPARAIPVREAAPVQA